MFILMRATTYSALFIGFLLLFLPGRLLEWSGVTRPRQLGVPQIAGASLVFLGAGVALWCVATFVVAGRGTPAPFDPPRRLVISGPYHFIRNPMYWGATLALGGAGVFYQSIALVAYAVLFWAAAHGFVCGYEEPTLRGLFGQEYAGYCRHVRRWWPIRTVDREGMPL